MQLVVTIFEPTVDAALNAVRTLDRDHDMIEIRVDAFGGGALEPFRDATTKPIIFTNRGGEPVDIDFGLIDVEFGHAIKHPARTVLSFHDFEGMPDLDALIEAMRAKRCAYTKIAVTPANFADNERILAPIRPGLTIFGMGERGLYSRILAPFLGSELAFVSVDEQRTAAPGQLSLDRALAIYGDRKVRRPDHIFAIVGNPAGHSLGPAFHNRCFRERGVAGVYTIASVAAFDEVIGPFKNGRLTGMSVTAPFKENAFEFAQAIRASIGRNAIDARAVNTLVTTSGGVIADNTDVDGFEALLRDQKGKTAAVIGAGGTGRAAVVALRRAGFDVKVYNRTPRDGALPLSHDIRADVIINTLPAGVHVNVNATFDAAYAGGSATGRALFDAQAIRQNELFLKAFE